MEAQKAEADSPEEQDRAKRNLKAQEDVARWAKIMLGIGSLELLITTIGVGLVLLTLRETRRIGEAQIRAYVTITSAKVEFAKTHTNELLPVVTITAENAGQSLAKNFAWGMTLQVVHGYPPDLAVIQRGFEDWQNLPGIAISAAKPYTDTMTIWGFPTEQIKHHRHSARFLLSANLRIRYQYKDVFDNQLSQTAYFAGGIRWSIGVNGINFFQSELQPQPEMIDWIDHDRDQKADSA